MPDAVTLPELSERSGYLSEDRAIGNLQQWLIGTYHGVSKEQLQVYLDEFVFRHNRRRQPDKQESSSRVRRHSPHCGRALRNASAAPPPNLKG